MTIPRIIHQTWKDHHAHPALNYCMDTIQFQNPEWDWRFYADEDCLLWVKESCPEWLKVYQGYQTGIHRADFFRILVLYYEGGVYADIDVECLRPLDELLSKLEAGKTCYLTRDHPIHERIHFGGRAMWMNDFMIAAPGDPLMGEILHWMVNSPPSSGASANAVMETGPGVVSSVIEMLGGVDQLPNLVVIPTPWVHPLPDMNCGFPEKHFYGQAIAQRSWLKREAFVVHYWFHTWVGAQTNTLTDYAEMLMSTLGEQVERKLQWLLGSDVTDADSVIAAAVAEFAEMRGVVRLYVANLEEPLVDRFLDVLAMSGLKPRIQMIVQGSGLEKRVEALQSLGVEVLYPNSPSVAGAMAWSGKVLFVAEPKTDLSAEVAGLDGLILGPGTVEGEVISASGALCLTCCTPASKRVPQLVHLLPGQHDEPWSTSALFFRHGYTTREWNSADVDGVLRDASLGTWNLQRFTPNDSSVAAALAILYSEGGVVYQGDRIAVAERLQQGRPGGLVCGDNFWMFACEKESPLLRGALRHWVDLRLRSRAEAPKADGKKANELDRAPVNLLLLDFLQHRLRFAYRGGLGGSWTAEKVGGFQGK